MIPVINQSRAFKLNEIKQLEKKIQKKRKKLIKKEAKFRRVQRMREQKQEIHDYEMQDLIEDQQILIKEATQASSRYYSLFNEIMGDFKVQKQIIVVEMNSQNNKIQSDKRKSPIQSEQKQQILEIKNPKKKIKKNEIYEEGKMNRQGENKNDKGELSEIPRDTFNNLKQQKSDIKQKQEIFDVLEHKDQHKDMGQEQKSVDWIKQNNIQQQVSKINNISEEHSEEQEIQSIYGQEEIYGIQIEQGDKESLQFIRDKTEPSKQKNQMIAQNERDEQSQIIQHQQKQLQQKKNQEQSLRNQQQYYQHINGHNQDQQCSSNIQGDSVQNSQQIKTFQQQNIHEEVHIKQFNEPQLKQNNNPLIQSPQQVLRPEKSDKQKCQEKSKIPQFSPQNIDQKNLERQKSFEISNNKKIDDNSIQSVFPQDILNHPQTYLQCLLPNKIPYYILPQNNFSRFSNQIKPDPEYFLDHYHIPVQMNKFIKCDWKNVSCISLIWSNLNNQDFEMLSNNSQIFPMLKTLYLSCNPKFTHVTVGMLQKFKKIQQFHFGKPKNNCYLSQKSIQEVKKFKKLKPQVQIKSGILN